MENKIKLAQASSGVLPEIAKRWSPYALNGKSVSSADMRLCLEAASWAASSYNEQPWRFIVAFKDQPEEFAKALDCLMEANQVWARHAGALMFTVVATSFARNNSPNRTAEHDLGLAMGNFSIQATKMGLSVHQMGGVNLSKVRQTYLIPDGFNPVTAVAIGYAAESQSGVDAELWGRDQQPRSRKPVSEITFAGKWGSSGF